MQTSTVRTIADLSMREPAMAGGTLEPAMPPASPSRTRRLRLDPRQPRAGGRPPRGHDDSRIRGNFAARDDKRGIAAGPAGPWKTWDKSGRARGTRRPAAVRPTAWKSALPYVSLRGGRPPTACSGPAEGGPVIGSGH